MGAQTPQAYKYSETIEVVKMEADVAEEIRTDYIRVTSANTEQ